MSSSLAEQLAEQLSEKLAQWGFSWRGLRDNRHGEWWLLGQLSLIALHLLPPLPAPASYGIVWPLAMRLVGWSTFGLGLLLAAQAAFNLGPSLTPLPEPMAGTALITNGAYGRCRHPLFDFLPAVNGGDSFYAAHGDVSAIGWVGASQPAATKAVD
jgi:protein-S-isoprenylcysteine O-methyltransferase Ste14